MGEPTKEIDTALKNTVHLLSTISSERIRDEFLKGIKSSKSVIHFLKMIEKYGVFDWIFKGLKVSNLYTDQNDPVLVIGYLLKDNDASLVNKQLNVLKYTIEEIRAITFLINLLKLTPETAVQLKRMQKNSGVTDSQIKTFGEKMNIDNNLLKAFVDFRLSVNGEVLMKQLDLKPGKELGDAINRVEYDNFKKLL